MKPFTDNKHYSDFKAQLARALERVLHIHLSAVDQIVSKLEDKIIFATHHSNSLNQFRLTGTGPIKNELMLASVQVSEIVRRNRAEVYTLAHSGEAEGMSRAIGKPLKSNPDAKKHKDKDAPSGGTLDARMDLYFERLGRDIQDAIQLSHVFGENLGEIQARIRKCFPKTRKIQSTPALSRRKLKEADAAAPIPSLSVGITNESTWNDILDDYNSTTLPANIFKRGPVDKTLYYDVSTGETDERYTWEVEQEITEDFVNSVREGKIDAAKENGYTDFQWIAVIDSHTDDCCADRDGLSSSEIAEQLANGTLDPDDCDAVVAPGHFNCRCDNAPMTDEDFDTDPVDYGDFDDWLNDKAA